MSESVKYKSQKNLGKGKITDKFLPRSAAMALDAWMRLNKNPLLLTGPRQTGKSSLVNNFGKSNFEDVCYVNLLSNTEAQELFTGISPAMVVSSLEKMLGHEIAPGKTLLILDEIQACPRAIECLGHIKEQHPKLHIIACGSPVDFAKLSADFHVPIGRLSYLEMKPLTFTEFLLATNKLELHRKLLSADSVSDFTADETYALNKELNIYIMVGGMPEIVSAYVNSNGDMSEVRKCQAELISSIDNAFASLLQECHGIDSKKMFLRMLTAISTEVTDLSEIGSKSAEKVVQSALVDIFNSGFFSCVNSVSKDDCNLFDTASTDVFRTVFIDVGLLFYALTCKKTDCYLQDPIGQYGGILARQFVGQEILSGQSSSASLFGLTYSQHNDHILRKAIAFCYKGQDIIIGDCLLQQAGEDSNQYIQFGPKVPLFVAATRDFLQINHYVEEDSTPAMFSI